MDRFAFGKIKLRKAYCQGEFINKSPPRNAGLSTKQLMETEYHSLRGEVWPNHLNAVVTLVSPGNDNVVQLIPIHNFTWDTKSLFLVEQL